MKTFVENIKQILAFIVVVSGIAYIFVTTLIPPKNTDSQGLIAIVGFVNLVAGYYWGASQGGQKKDETINNLINKKDELHSSKD